MRWLSEPSPALAPHAVAMAREAVRTRADAPGAWLALGTMLAREGHAREAREALREAADRAAPTAALRLALARAELGMGDQGAALAAVEAALALEPRNQGAIALRFQLLVAAGEREEAGELADAVERADPADAYLLSFRYASCASRAEKRRFAQDCGALLARRPFCTAAAHYRALALADLGEVDAAVAAIGLREVEIRDLAVPTANGDGAAFRASLAQEILANPTLVPDPRGKATRRGRQTARLRQPGAAAVDGLLQAIQEEVSAFASAPGGAAPDVAELHAWAVVLEAEGRQSSHYHPGGWLSGVFYVTAPPDPAGEGHSGPLLLGAVAGASQPWPVREVEPRPGRLVLFPSQLSHATRASKAEGLRISVAFDVVPSR